MDFVSLSLTEIFYARLTYKACDSIYHSKKYNHHMPLLELHSVNQIGATMFYTRLLSADHKRPMSNEAYFRYSAS